MNRKILCLLPVLAAGCIERTTLVRGRVLDHPPAAGQSRPVGLAGARVRMLDEIGALYENSEADKDGTATTDDQGDFRVHAPRGQTVYALIDADGYAVTSFSGVSGFESSLTVETGLLYGLPTDHLDGYRALFAGCPVQGDGAGWILGEVRVFNLVEPGLEEEPGTIDPLIHPLVTTASVTALDQEGIERSACYLDAEGVYDPEAVVTGPTGFFAIPGVPVGLHTLSVGYSLAEGINVEPARTELWMANGEDVVAPRFPAWVEFQL